MPPGALLRRGIAGSPARCLPDRSAAPSLAPEYRIPVGKFFLNKLKGDGEKGAFFENHNPAKKKVRVKDRHRKPGQQETRKTGFEDPLLGVHMRPKNLKSLVESWAVKAALVQGILMQVVRPWNSGPEDARNRWMKKKCHNKAFWQMFEFF